MPFYKIPPIGFKFPKGVGYMLQKIRELDPEIIIADGFDDCLIGITVVDGEWVALYNAFSIVSKLAQEMDWDEALDYFEYNILGAYVGPKTPEYVWVEDDETSEDGFGVH